MQKKLLLPYFPNMQHGYRQTHEDHLKTVQPIFKLRDRVFVSERKNVCVLTVIVLFSGSYGALHLQKIKLVISLSLICA